MGYNIVDIEGIGESYALKLKEYGISTVEQLLDAGKEFRHRKAENLVLCHRTPSATELQKMIDEVSELEPMVFY